MDQSKKINQLESEVNSLKAQVDFISKRFGLVPGQKDLDHAIEQIILYRDATKLEEYIERGGIIPGSKYPKGHLRRRGMKEATA